MIGDAGARIIAGVRGAEAGPTLIVIGGMHGNEPAGIAAARAVLGEVDPGAVRGEILALVGNRRAVAAGRRQLGRDLNRMWTSELMAAALARNVSVRELDRSAGRDAEASADGERLDAAVGARSTRAGGVDRNPGGNAAARAELADVAASAANAPELDELVELGAVIDEAIARARGPVHLLDLHTTSAPGFAFAVVGATPEHRRFAAAFQLPGIVGLEAALPGVLTGYYGARGCITLAIEGGQHTTGAAADNLAAVITVALEASGAVAAVPGAAAARAHLAGVRGDLPAMIEVVLRHPVQPGDGFGMAPGFANLQPTVAGALLARDHTGEIRAPFDGIVLLPLYQPDGDDGFFFGRPIAP